MRGRVLGLYFGLPHKEVVGGAVGCLANGIEVLQIYALLLVVQYLVGSSVV